MKFYENARRLTFPTLIIAPPLHTKATVLCEAKELISAHVAVRKTSRNKVTSNFAESVSVTPRAKANSPYATPAPRVQAV